MLNDRLLACAGYITPGAHVCDVGCDHAQLAVYLLENAAAKTVIASDIGEGPLQAAERTIRSHGLSGKITTILSDGLESIPPEGLTHVVIAGMGGETMIHILERCPFALDRITLVLQPMTKARELRRWLYNSGFAINAETAVRDERYLYAVMRANFTGNRIEPDTVQEFLGAMDLTDADCMAYAERVYAQLCKARDGRRQAGQPDAPYAGLAQEIFEKLEAYR